MPALRVADLAKMVQEMESNQQQIADNMNLQTSHINELQHQAGRLKKVVYTLAGVVGVYSLASLISLI
jgi:septal ring factor EnvC (AmiA/AmiB activator)